MRRCWVSVVVVTSALLALTACSGNSHAGGTGKATLSPTGKPSAVALALPHGTRIHAVLRVASGFRSVRIVAANVGDFLLEASAGAHATAAPVLTSRAGTVTVTQAKHAPLQPVLVVQLARSVTWKVDLAGGSSTVRMNLSSGRLAGVRITKGLSSLVMTVPAPTGTLPVHMSAGASSVRLRVQGGAAVRATMGGGASAVTLYGATTHGIPAGTRLASPGWASAHNRIVVTCSAGVSHLVVARS